MSSQSYLPSSWRVHLIPDPASSSEPLHTGRCYVDEQLIKYDHLEISEVYDIGAIATTFHIKFQRVNDPHPTYIAIYFDEVLMDHFYVAAEEEWVTSFGWQKNGVEVFKYRFAPLDSSQLYDRTHWFCNPALLGHISIQLYHLSEQEAVSFSPDSCYLKRPIKSRFHEPRLSLYAIYEKKSSNLFYTRKRFSNLPNKIPFHYIYFRYDDAIRKEYNCPLALQVPIKNQSKILYYKRITTTSNSYSPSISKFILSPTQVFTSSDQKELEYEEFDNEINKIYNNYKKQTNF